MPISRRSGTTLTRMAGGLLVAAFLALPHAGSAVAAEDETAATANMVDAEGNLVAKVSLNRMAEGTRIVLSGNGLPPGVHAFHVHQTGKCDPGDGFKSAGGHYNPAGHQHGWDNAKGHHAGDLPNVHVGENGVAAVEIFSAAVVLDGDLFDEDGAAMVMHAGPDDYRSDPAGDAGTRIACGVIKAGKG